MAEIDDYLARQQRRMIQRQSGSGVERVTVQAYSQHWEVAAVSLPAYSNNQTLLQNPATGAFITMLGIDGAPADPLGRT